MSAEKAMSYQDNNYTKFRRVLGHYPTGVCAITAKGVDGRPVGMIVGSFTSVSLDPMLVGFFPTKSSATWRKIQAARHFCANVLSASQGSVCEALASRSDDKFSALEFHHSSLGAPIISGALAWIECDLEAVYEAGDHHFVLGKVRSLEVQDDGAPMIFHKGNYIKVQTGL